MDEYKLVMDKYMRWYDNMVTFISDHYYCHVRYPRHVDDIDSGIDGLRINFDNGNLAIVISNMVMYQIWVTETRNRAYNTKYRIAEYVDNLIMSNFKKYL